jgi:hypothetical protein
MREIILRISQAGGRKIRWSITVIPKTRVTAFIAVRNALPKLEINHGPIPRMRIIASKPRITNITGIQARRSDSDGIIVLLTVKTRYNHNQKSG